ncbi:hypothetical protein V8E54_013791 [Elaphomyces granulatus]|jgi:hypothetical protein
MLLVFVQEVGHKYDDLLKGADEDSYSEVNEEDDLMLLAATREIDLSQGDRRVKGEKRVWKTTTMRKAIMMKRC